MCFMVEPNHVPTVLQLSGNNAPSSLMESIRLSIFCRKHGETMKEYDTLIKNGYVVLPDRVQKLDIGIRDGCIAAIGEGLHAPASLEYNAENRYIFPGGIDVHVHFNEPGREDWEGFSTGSAMMAAGGMTTYFDMPLNGIPSTVSLSALHEKTQIAGQKSIVDFGLWGGLVPGNEEELAGFADGVIGFKAFMSPSGNPQFERADDQTLLQGMKQIAKLGSLLALHAESAPMIKHMQAEQTGTDADAYAGSRPIEAETEAVQRAINFAKLTGCPLHFVHISNAETIDTIEEAKQDGMDITVETCAHYLLFNHSSLQTQGAAAKCAPPLRPEKERQHLVQYLLDGKIDIVSSDHSPCPPELKDTTNMFTAWGGINGGQFTLMALIETALRYQVPLSRVAAWVSSNPAARFQLDKTKGEAAVGKTADLVVVDLETSHTITAQDLYTKHQQSLYIDHTFPCRIIQTFYQGEVVYHHQTGVTNHPSSI